MGNRRRKTAVFLSLTLLVSTLLAGFPGVSSFAATTVQVVPSAKYQVHEGFGTSLAWWGNEIGGWPDSKRSDIADLIFDPDEGLGLNIVRYNIGGGDDPSHDHMRPGGEMPGFQAADGTWDWSADANQRWVLLAAQQRAGSEFVAEAFSNSPPYWMTYSGCASGNGADDNLRPEYYDDFAHYLTEVVKHYRDQWGVNFKTLEPFNEPEADWWNAFGGQEGSHFDPSTQMAVLEEVRADLDAKGLNTKISAMDSSSISGTVDEYQAYDSQSKSYVDQINTHGYYGSVGDRSELHRIAHEDGKELWMSESDGAGGSDPFAEFTHDPDAIAPALDLSWRIRTDLKHLQPSAWVFWQAVENWPNQIRENKNWGLILANFEGQGAEGLDAQAYRIAKKYYAMAQYSKFIRPGFQQIFIGQQDALAYADWNSGRLVIVQTNHGTSDVDYTYDLSAFDSVGGTVSVYRTSANENLASLSDISISNGAFTATAKAESITTYVIDGISDSSSAPDFDPNADYKIVSRHSGKVLTVSGTDKHADAAPIQQFTDSGEAYQRWQIVDAGDGYFHIINRYSGDYMDIDGASLEDGADNIQWPANGGLNQEWEIIDLGNGYYHIVNRNSGKLLDISEASTEDGAQSHQWRPNGGYNQQWQIIAD